MTGCLGALYDPSLENPNEVIQIDLDMRQCHPTCLKWGTLSRCYPTPPPRIPFFCPCLVGILPPVFKGVFWGQPPRVYTADFQVFDRFSSCEK